MRINMIELDAREEGREEGRAEEYAKTAAAIAERDAALAERDIASRRERHVAAHGRMRRSRDGGRNYAV